MQATVQTGWAPKCDVDVREFEDAFSYTSVRRARRMQTYCDQVTVQAETLRVAVADGATTSLLSGPWADALVRAWVRGHVDGAMVDQDELARARRIFTRWSSAYERRRNLSSNPIQWYEEPGLLAGAHAALLTLEVRQSSEGGLELDARGWGDTCLFVRRLGGDCSSVPATPDFPPYPNLLNSRKSRSPDWEQSWQEDSALQLYLTTDSLGAYLLKPEGDESLASALRTLDEMLNGASWLDRLDEARRHLEMADDDITVVKVTFSPGGRDANDECPSQ